MKADRHAMVPEAEPRTYYDQPVIKAPVWTIEIPWYLFVGGLAGGSSILSAAARRSGHDELARVSSLIAGGGALVSPALLVSDLGRPERFVNMLRVFKPTSPMSMGSWILAGYGPVAVAGAALDLVGAADRLPLLRRVASIVAAGSGAALATYTAVLLSDTAVPVWHDARFELPWAFAGGAMQSAGALALVFVDPDDAAPARWALAAGTIQREAATELMVHRLGEWSGPLRSGLGGRHRTASRLTSLAGAGLALTVGRRSRAAAVAGGLLATAGAAFERFAVFRAGFDSAADPRATTVPQRRRLEDRTGS